jgi:hypothetical protein
MSITDSEPTFELFKISKQTHKQPSLKPPTSLTKPRSAGTTTYSLAKTSEPKQWLELVEEAQPSPA